MTEQATKYLLVMSTCPGAAAAQEIAEALVAARLAACVQIVPGVQAFFTWAGRPDSAEESLLLIKTTAACYEALAQKIKALHSYELPEIIAVPIHGGSAEYLSWIDDCTDPS